MQANSISYPCSLQRVRFADFRKRRSRLSDTCPDRACGPALAQIRQAYDLHGFDELAKHRSIIPVVHGGLLGGKHLIEHYNHVSDTALSQFIDRKQAMVNRAETIGRDDYD